MDAEFREHIENEWRWGEMWVDWYVSMCQWANIAGPVT